MHPLVENEPCPAALLVVVRCERAARSHSGRVHPPAVIGSCQCRTRRVEFAMTGNGIQTEQTREEPMSDLQAIADRFEVEGCAAA
jgi:hypothetical protein